MNDEHLCDVCRSIDFEGLLFQTGDEYVTVSFGSFDELIQRSLSCQLCALVVETATTNNGGEVPQHNLKVYA